MNGIDHYKRAEELAERVASGRVSTYDQDAYAALAQTHATLALASAMADATAFQTALYELHGLQAPTKEARKRMAADKSREAANDYI
ncbi:hypothetical protein ACIREM_43525 [Streptomyces shenzhenensis]|uniref:hypothetical protein n=1 Tax=Streptomyces shenzhenensis TaxID=943815 RepID=UPI0037FC10A4